MDDKILKLLEKLQNPDTSAQVTLSNYKYLLKENGPGVYQAIAKCPYTPAEILEEIKNHDSIVVRHLVARNQNLFLDSLREMLTDKDMLVRDYALLNYQTRKESNSS